MIEPLKRYYLRHPAELWSPDGPSIVVSEEDALVLASDLAALIDKLVEPVVPLPPKEEL